MDPQTLSRNRKIGILLICCMSLFMVGLDITVVNVALPAIGQDLDADISGLQWTVSAYTVVMASLLMFAGSTADRFGRKGTFVAGLVVFSAASLLCSAAPSLETITNAAVSGLPRAQAGVAAAIATTSRQVGQTLGVAVVGAIVASQAADADLAAASHAGWWTLTGCGFVVLLLGLVATTSRAGESARRTAAELNPEALAA
jgi:MFS family permease